MRAPALLIALSLVAGAVHAQTPTSRAAMSKPAGSTSAAVPPNVDPAAQNLLTAENFLETNAKAPGVHTLPIGLQYKVLAAGTGVSPKLGDAVKVNYEGKLLDGTVFDSSFQRGKPAVMQLARLVPAWLVALPLMHVGDEWMLYVPPALGYGESGKGPIPPNSVMVFRIKLLGALTVD